MNSKTPQKVMLEEETRHWRRYRFACDCGEKDHDITIDFEFDKEPSIVWVKFYKDLKYADWWGYWHDHWWNWFNRMWRRIKGASRLLVLGLIEIEDEFVIGNEESIDSFIWILEQGKNYLKHK